MCKQFHLLIYINIGIMPSQLTCASKLIKYF
nr:MAG TPA: hypothetical protein [Bacteriophage sp.]